MANLNTDTLGFTGLTAGAKKVLLDFICPIGNYIITENSSLNSITAMANHYGGTWVKVDDGRFLEAGSSIENKDAGLPNITGSIKNIMCYGNMTEMEGAFTKVERASERGWEGNNGDDNKKIYFDASGSNAIYGKSTTVQPKSRTVYMYRRTA